MAIDPDQDHRPCPFKGGWYQWMRNLVACRAMTKPHGSNGAVLVVYADNPFPMARKVKGPGWKAMTKLSEAGSVPLVGVSYQSLLKIAVDAAAPEDELTVTKLRAWILRKIARVAAESAP